MFFLLQPFCSLIFVFVFLIFFSEEKNVFLRIFISFLGNSFPTAVCFLSEPHYLCVLLLPKFYHFFSDSKCEWMYPNTEVRRNTEQAKIQTQQTPKAQKTFCNIWTHSKVETWNLNLQSISKLPIFTKGWSPKTFSVSAKKSHKNKNNVSFNTTMLCYDYLSVLFKEIHSFL